MVTPRSGHRLDLPVLDPGPSDRADLDETSGQARPAPAGRRRVWPILVLSAVAILGWHSVGEAPLWLTIPAGLTVLFAAPTVLLRRRLTFYAPTGLEPWLLALAGTVFGLMVIPMAWNLAFLALGARTPLSSGWLLVLVAGCLVALWRWPGGREGSSRAGLPPPVRYLSVTEQVLLAGAVLHPVLAVIGAIRLNNDLGNGVAIAALFVGGLVLALLLARLPRVSEPVLLVVVYAVGLGLLLATALRGWEVTGHDIQREFTMFQLTVAQQHWVPGVPENAYNACLSITVLPTVVHQLTGIPELYVFRAVFQPLFALCPVIVYLIGRQVATRFISVIAAILFMIFPTYLTDMPYLNRQEIAFLFLGLAVLVVVGGGRDSRHPARTARHVSAHRARMIWAAAMGAAVIPSHYSTTYVFLVGLGVALVAHAILAWSRRRRIAAPVANLDDVAGGRPVLLNALVLALLAAATIGWTNFTHSGGQLEETIGASVQSFRGDGGTASSDVSYSIFSRDEGLSPQERLDAYRAQTIEESSDRRDGELYPLTVLADYPTTIEAVSDQPLTALGQGLQRLGVPVHGAISASRAASSLGMQLSVLLGLIFIVLGRFRGPRLSLEYLALVVGGLGIIATQIAVPSFTVDYGVLRAFQQSLFVFAPIMGIGIWCLISTVASRWAALLTGTIVLSMYATLTGLLPALLGGYPAQLQLANSGQYYDNYYVHDGEVAGMDWLRQHAVAAPGSSTGRAEIQSEVATDRYARGRSEALTGLPSADDVFPTLLRPTAYVFLGYPAVHQGRVSVFYSGDLLAYHYPVALLNDTKDLVYSNGSAEVYR
ncbi:MAG: hypothetical protein ACK5MT_03340 [Actinomycetales bacterium]